MAKDRLNPCIHYVCKGETCKKGCWKNRKRFFYVSRVTLDADGARP